MSNFTANALRVSAGTVTFSGAGNRTATFTGVGGALAWEEAGSIRSPFGGGSLLVIPDEGAIFPVDALTGLAAVSLIYGPPAAWADKTYILLAASGLEAIIAGWARSIGIIGGFEDPLRALFFDDRVTGRARWVFDAGTLKLYVGATRVPPAGETAGTLALSVNLTTGLVTMPGPLGIGVASPMTRIDILGAVARDAQIKVRSEATGSAIGGGVLLHHNNAGETFPVTGDRLGYVLFGTTVGASQFQGGGIVARAEGDYSATSTPTYFAFETAPVGSVTRATRLVIDKDGHTSPGTDNAYTIGKSGARFSAVWAATGTIQTSDARDKTVVGDLGFAGALIDAVAPVLFRWNVGGFDVVPSETETETDDDGVERPKLVPVPRSGARTHAGFLAQDLRAAMEAGAVDFGAWGREDKDDPDSRQWTRPDQLIPVLWAAVKEARAEIAALKARVDVIEGA